MNEHESKRAQLFLEELLISSKSCIQSFVKTIYFTWLDLVKQNLQKLYYPQKLQAMETHVLKYDISIINL